MKDDVKPRSDELFAEVAANISKQVADVVSINQEIAKIAAGMAKLEQLLLHAKLTPADPEIWNDGPRLRAWTIAYLDGMRRYVPMEVYDRLRRLQEELCERQRFVRKTKNSLVEMLVILKKMNPELQQAVPQRRGRPRGSKLVAANSDVSRIRMLWRITFGRQNRSAPSAVDIAAERHGTTAKKLAAYRRNQS